ncbi:cysteine-tryptophan domain-containing zinc finger protein 7-like isoform X2 [Rutidosis leptorrhynchoides]
MEFETEIEEGEAYDSTIDPDVSLSYIDEKIQDVLGDCQKDFEGGVSAENLGAKFGGYGSFLPAYQRSPISSYPKTPPISISSTNAHIEVGHQNPVSQSRGSAPRKSKSNSKKLKQDVVSNSGEKSNSFSSFANDSDPKSLKVRIRVSSDDLSTKRNTKLYSGLGLNVSPSCSLETSPVNSDGFFPMAQDGPNESPTSILEMMTSFPVVGSLLLSPLPYDVLHLTEKNKGSQESSVTALHGSDLVKVDQTVSIEKSQSIEKKSVSMESTNGDDMCNAVEVIPKKKKSVDHLSLGNKSSWASASSSKNKKKSHASKNDSFTSKNKNGEKVKETYKDFFGEFDLEHEDIDEMAHIKPSEDINVESTQENNGSSKEILNGKQSQNQSSSTMGNEIPSDVPAPTVVPVVKEDWVGCDKCEKWRLLPPGVNPSSLPEKWLCSMLDWLPGMNRCSISEEETTKATNARFLGPSVHSSQPIHPVGPHIGLDSVDASCPNGIHQHISSQVPSSGVKKKHGSKDVFNEVKQERPSMSSNSSKKNVHTSCKTRSLNGAKQSPLVNEPEFQDSGQSRNLIAEKNGLKLKENNKLRENIPSKSLNHSKIGNKRERTQDFPKECKKLKADSNDGKFDKRDVLKKRKNVTEIDGTGRYSKETSETNHKKDKKARLIKSFDEGKNTEDAKLLDHSRRDKVVAATTSSSKVSSSHKVKTNILETKESPVESVSSSPMRIMNMNKLQSPRRDSSSVDRLTKNVRDSSSVDRLTKNVRDSSSVERLTKNVRDSSRVDSLTKNVDTQAYDEKSKGGRHKSKELLLNKNLRISTVSGQDSKKSLEKDVYVKEKSNSLPPKRQNENSMPLKASKSNGKDQKDNVNQPISSKDPSANKHEGKIGNSVGVVLVKELPSQATTIALKEATNLKHMADRIKNGGSSTESRALYMQAALKFLYGASLFESSNNNQGGGIVQSMSIYNSTAKLCEFCAHEYERTKEMATAALAYKCMEVAHMKVIFSTHATNCKIVNELQTSLQVGPTGESPSSSASASASGIDNLNNVAMVDKAAALANGASVPSVAGKHVVDKNNPNFMRTLNFAQDVITAMDASRKSRICLAAADNSKEDVLSAVKRALDFNFHDMNEFLKLVRVAMEVIGT